jgi:hypothetical protein
MTCSFCGNEARADRLFGGVEDGGGRRGRICHDCVRDLYISMIAAEIRPPRPNRNSATRSSSGRAQIIRLHPRKN